MSIYRSQLIGVLSVAFLAMLATAARAQTGTDLLVKTWGEGARIETNSFGLMEAAGHTKDDDESIRLSQVHLLGRWRIFPDKPETTRIGYDFQYFDIATHDVALPRHLFNGQIGFAQPVAEYEKWFVAVTGTVGYAGESPLSDPRAVYEGGSIVVGRKFNEDRAFVVGLGYDGNRTYAPDIPLPGFAYTDRYNEFFSFVLGAPYSSITWEPLQGFQVEAGYYLLHTFEAKLAYQFAKNWAVFGEYDDQLSPFHIDNTSPDRRLFLQTHDFEAGVRFSLNTLVRLSVSGGWAFGQEFSTGFDARGLNPVRHLTDEPFAKLRLEMGF